MSIQSVATSPIRLSPLAILLWRQWIGGRVEGTIETCDLEEDLGWGHSRGPRSEVRVWSWDRSVGTGSRVEIQGPMRECRMGSRSQGMQSEVMMSDSQGLKVELWKETGRNGVRSNQVVLVMGIHPGLERMMS